jgi:hypothetical protein
MWCHKGYDYIGAMTCQIFAISKYLFSKYMNKLLFLKSDKKSKKDEKNYFYKVGNGGFH